MLVVSLLQSVLLVFAWDINMKFLAWRWYATLYLLKMTTRLFFFPVHMQIQSLGESPKDRKVIALQVNLDAFFSLFYEYNVA